MTDERAMEIADLQVEPEPWEIAGLVDYLQWNPPAHKMVRRLAFHCERLKDVERNGQRHISDCHERISALESENERLKAATEKWKNDKSLLNTIIDVDAEKHAEQRARIAELEQQIAELRKDAERLDWLEDRSCWIGLEGEFEVRPKITAGGIYSQRVRDAIDAARNAEQE